jgi:hypothetical protein
VNVDVDVDVVVVVVVVAVVLVAGGVVRTSLVVVGAGFVAVCVVGSAPTVVVAPELFRPALIRITAIVTAARNAAGAPYRVSS